MCRTCARGFVALGVLLLWWVALCSGCRAQEQTTITVTNEPVVRHLCRFGINLGGDAWYSGAILTKERIRHGGFEGIVYRQLTYGPGGDRRSYFDWFPLGKWGSVIKGATYWFVSGPRKGLRGKIVDVKQEVYPTRPDKGALPRYIFDAEGPAPQANDGLFIERVEPTVGFLGQHGNAYWVFCSGGATVRTVAGDVPPGSKGRVVAQLSAPGQAKADILAAALSTKWAHAEGTWRLRFWAKGSGNLLVYLGEFGRRGKNGYLPQRVALSPQWKHHEVVFPVRNYPFTNLCVGFEVSAGTVFLDELSFTQDGEKNPTPFRDAVVQTLKMLNPGTLRHLQMGGSTLDNILAPRAWRMAYSYSRGSAPPDGTWPGHPDSRGAAKTHPYGLHEFLQLCEEVGACPWYCVPGTFTTDEMKNLVEYLAGPADSPYGKIRAARGHPKPWTEVFDKIYIEIGNEAWNQASAFRFGGYSVKGEYWNDLFAAGKASPYYTDKIRFQAAGQAVYVGRNVNIARQTPLADGFAVAPYIIHDMSKEQAKLPDDQLFLWAFGYPWYQGHYGYMAENFAKVTKQFGKELALYEVNHHITGGDAPAEPRNRIVTSVGGALNVINWMLMMLERQHVRVQNFFTLAQFGYRMRGGETVRLWGAVISMKRGEERYRPTFLALMLANKVLFGDLVRVRKSGADPTWLCAHTYVKKQQQKQFRVPYIHAYATREGARRGLILLNLHPSAALPAAVSLPAPPKPGTARCWTLSGPSIAANNEPEHEPQVRVLEQPLPGFSASSKLTLKPHSMTVIRWEEQ